MNKLKSYLKNLIKQNTYRGWHLVQAEKVTHSAITNALLGIQKFSKKGIFLATDENLIKLSELKEEAMSYTVPEQYKEEHLKLILSFSLLDEYFKLGDLDKKDQAYKHFKDASEAYGSL